MIASEAFRGRGLAVDALRLFLSYAYQELRVRHFRAKILEKNKASITFFEKKLGFTLHSRKPIFEEVWYDLKLA
eukprot:g4229.t1